MPATILLRTCQVVFLAVIFPVIILVFSPILAVLETVSNLFHLFRSFIPEKEHQPFSRQRTPEFEVLIRKQNEAKKCLTNVLTKGNGDLSPNIKGLG